MSLMLDVKRRIAAAEARAAAAETDPLDDAEEIDPADVPDEYRKEPEVGEVRAADPAAVADYCTANGCPDLAAPLIRQKATMKEVEARIGAAETIRAIVTDAGTITESITAAKAEEFIRAGLSVEQVRLKVWSAICDAQSPEIRSSISVDTGADTAQTRAVRAMDAAVARANAQIPDMQRGEG